MIKGCDFVFTGLQPWDLPIGSNARDIALEISKNNRVLYVNTPLSGKFDRGSDNQADQQRIKVLDKKAQPLRQVNSNLWVVDYPFTVWPINFLPDGKLFDLANRINNRKMYSFVRKIIRQLKFHDYTLFIDNDMYRSFYAKEFLNPRLSVYYRRDNMVSDFWRKHAERIEPLISAKCDCVLANSEELAAAVRPYNSHSYSVGQGVDLSNYDSQRIYETPDDMKNIPHPIIGYTGMLTSQRLDINLIFDLVQKCPNYSFVMVGGEDKAFKTSTLHNLSNIFFLGMKDPSLMPQYISAFDVCINPQLINKITIGNYPRKIDEYLALGKPVVATKTDTMSIFATHTWVCSGADEYKSALEQALLSISDESKKEQRIAFAHTHSWENCVNDIYQKISEHLNKQ